MFSRGSRAAHKQSGQVFSNAAVLNSSWFNKLMLLFSEWQSGYLSIIILRDSFSNAWLSVWLNRHSRSCWWKRREQKWAAAASLGKGSPVTEGPPVNSNHAGTFVPQMVPSQWNTCLSSESFALMCLLSVTSAIYVAAVTSTEVGWGGALQKNADWFAGGIYRAKN